MGSRPLRTAVGGRLPCVGGRPLRTAVRGRLPPPAAAPAKGVQWYSKVESLRPPQPCSMGYLGEYLCYDLFSNLTR